MNGETIHEYINAAPTPDDFVVPTPTRDLPNYDNDVRRFVDAMNFKLRKNAGKGRWEDIGLAQALALLKKEVEELEEAIRGGNTIEIILEAADVANFAMIASSIAIERMK